RGWPTRMRRRRMSAWLILGSRGAMAKPITDTWAPSPRRGATRVSSGQSSRGVATVSSEQLKLLTDAVHDGFDINARPLQKVNYRDINFFCPDDHHERYYAAADH
uniref:Uncharacterized protein n=1 Tax=Aegilops tauschii subsp. strangulata TaxID=200361 RepID=A0A453T9B4_AEGTS